MAREARDPASVQHIRIDDSDHAVVRRVAREEVRSITDQYRKIVKEWVSRQGQQ